MDRQENLERLAVHAAYGLHIIAKWMSEEPSVSKELKERLSTHLMAVDSSLRALGRTALHDEIEKTEGALAPR